MGAVQASKLAETVMFSCEEPEQNSSGLGQVGLEAQV